jgi:HlyD family secretion protein
MPDKGSVNPPRKWLTPALLTVLAIAGIGYASRNLILGSPVPAYEAVRSDLTQTVVASGRVITPQRISVGTEVTGRVARIPVKEGQSVTRGQILIELEDADERATVAQAAAAVTQAEAKLRQLREVGLPAAEQSLKQAQANAIQARKQFERIRDLQAKGFVGQSQLDDATRNLDVAASQVRAAELQVQSEGPAGSDFALAQAALEQARASLLLAKAKLEQDVIRAAADGILIARNVEPGDIVQPGKELMLLAAAGETQIVTQIDEKNLGKLAAGQKALGSADAFPGQRFPAELVYINPGIDALRGSVEVKLRVSDPPPYLRQDMTVSVDIEISRSKDTVVIPSDAVHESGGSAPWVLVIRKQRAERQPVKLGLIGDGRVEVLSGIAAGEAVVPATNGTVKAGAHVRAAVTAGAARTAP